MEFRKMVIITLCTRQQKISFLTPVPSNAQCPLKLISGQTWIDSNSLNLSKFTQHSEYIIILHCYQLVAASLKYKDKKIGKEQVHSETLKDVNKRVTDL